VPYSHKLHAGQLGLDCFYCHFTVYKAAYAAIPPTETCMNCHNQNRVKDKSPRLEPVRQKLRDGAAGSVGQDPPVTGLRSIFNHQSHVTAGVSCVSCHGRIDQMIEVHQESL